MFIIVFYKINRDSYFIDNNVKITTAPPQQDHGHPNKETTMSIGNIGSIYLTLLSIRIYPELFENGNCYLYDKNTIAKHIVHDVRHIQQQSVFMFLQVGTPERIIDVFHRLKGAIVLPTKPQRR